MYPSLKARSQQNNDATYAEKVTKDEAQIDWHQSAEQISRVIRAFNPRPIAYTNAMAKQFKNRVLRIIEAEVVNRQPLTLQGRLLNMTKTYAMLLLLMCNKSKEGPTFWEKRGLH